MPLSRSTVLIALFISRRIRADVKLKLMKRFGSRKGAEFLEQIAFVPASCWTHFTNCAPTKTAEPLESVLEMPPVA